MRNIVVRKLRKGEDHNAIDRATTSFAISALADGIVISPILSYWSDRAGLAKLGRGSTELTMTQWLNTAQRHNSSL